MRMSGNTCCKMVVINFSENKMKFLIVLVVVIAVVQGRREKIDPELAELLKDPRLFKLIAKRFQNILDKDTKSDTALDKSVVDTKSHLPEEKPSATDDLFSLTKKDGSNISSCKRQSDGYSSIADSQGNSCVYKENQNKIIRSNESVKSGAHFLRSEKSTSRCECVKSCCYTQGCTLAVFENKVRL